MEEKKMKVSWKGWLSLAYLIVAFSGIFANQGVCKIICVN